MRPIASGGFAAVVIPILTCVLAAHTSAPDQQPEKREVVVERSGANDCEDLPLPPKGVPGLREYLRITVHHDGAVLVKAARLPFGSNQGYVYKQTPTGWVKNDVDYILIRTPVPVQGGFVYSITFGEGEDRCGPWSIDATHPN